MLIAIDGVGANDPERVGVSVYTYELLKYFHRHSSEEVRFVIYLKDNPRDDMPPQTAYFRYRVVPGPFLWSRVFFPLALMIDKKPDVFFAPAHYLPPYVPCKSIVTIHDVAYEYYPNEFLKADLYKLKNWTRSAVDKTSKVIAVSEHTKKDILKFYSVSEDKVMVIYNGFSHKFQVTNSKKQTNSKFQILNSKFILYVGTLQPRKNITTLIESFSQLINETNGDLKLVIVGKKGWLYDKIFQKVRTLKLEDRVILAGYIADSELSILYQNASVFVLPSLYEGFGIPILEAMNYGCPVIAANTSSLPEIGGDACFYFDPSDTIDLKNKIVKILEDKKFRDELIKKGKERIKEFSWEKCAEETFSLLKLVATG